MLMSVCTCVHAFFACVRVCMHACVHACTMRRMSCYDTIGKASQLHVAGREQLDEYNVDSSPIAEASFKSNSKETV